MPLPETAIIRITDAGGKTLGTGFVIAADEDGVQVLTCRHVIADATHPRAAFPGETSRPARLLRQDPIHDIALLRLEGRLPPEAAPLRLGPSAAAAGAAFRTRGYRPMGELEGIPAAGEVLGAVGEAPDAAYPPLVLRSQHVRGGMSGAPVFLPALGLAVGMLTAYWDAAARSGFADRDTAFATPAEAIAALTGVPLHAAPQRPPSPAAGERAVVVQGDLSHAVIVTGDNVTVQADPPPLPRGTRAGLERALQTARRSLAILERQAAGYTSLTIPAPLQIELEDKRRQVAALERRLQTLEE